MTSKPNSWIESLNDVRAILDGADVIWFLDMGTLLGAIRDGDFIAWDNDIDIGIIQSSDTHQKIMQTCDKLEQKGYDVAYCDKSISVIKKPDVEINITIYMNKDGDLTSSYLVPSKLYSIRNGIKMILEGKYYIHSKSKRKQILRVIMNNSKLVAFMANEVLDYMFGELNYKYIKIKSEHLARFDNYTFKNLQVKIPYNTEEYLNLRYGHDWKTPKKKWTYFKDDKSISHT
jgi:phosphorylcholine metabolism protein LicD